MADGDLIECAEALLHAAKLYDAGKHGSVACEELYLEILREMIENFCKTIEARLKTK